MPVSNLASEILSIAGSAIPDGPSQGVLRIEGVVGDAPSFVLAQSFAAQTTTLTRVPAGSSATIASNAISPNFDKPGLYRVGVSAGGFSRTIEFVVFPASTLNLAVSPFNKTSGNVLRVPHLRGIAQDPLCSQANITASLEASPSTLVGLLGGSSSPNFQAYGNS